VGWLVADISSIKRLVQAQSSIKHMNHIRQFADIPSIQWLVEGTCLTEHVTNVSFFAHFPVRDDVEFTKYKVLE
jgi:hypothetical protein